MACTYQLHITLHKPLSIDIGRLGHFDFPAGKYIYTGSAKKNMEARVKRHLKKEKTCRWHIDYLLVQKDAEVTQVSYSDLPECEVNQATRGEVIVKKFGASDCQQHCISHLKKIS